MRHAPNGQPGTRHRGHRAPGTDTRHQAQTLGTKRTLEDANPVSSVVPSEDRTEHRTPGTKRTLEDSNLGYAQGHRDLLLLLR